MEAEKKKHITQEEIDEQNRLRNLTHEQMEQIRKEQREATPLVSTLIPLQDLCNEFYDAPNFLKKVLVGIG